MPDAAVRRRIAAAGRLPWRASGRAGAGVVHAAGRPLAAGVPGGAGRHQHAGELQRPDLVAEITLQPVRRYGVDAAIFYSDIMVPLKAAGVDLDIVSGPRTGASPTRSAGRRTSSSCGRWTPDALWYVTEAVGQLVAELGRGAADRVRRRPVHPGQLSGRGRTEQGLRADQGADGRRARSCGTGCAPGWPSCRRPSSGSRWRPAPGRCSCSTPGPAASVRPTTPGTPSPTRPRCSARWPSPGCRGSTSGSAPVSCSA